MVRMGSLAGLLVLTGVLWPPATALADPPGGRSHGYEYQAGGCKYERKWERGGYKEEYKCEHGPRLAGGPPPWAPAHGYRRQHGHRQHHREPHVNYGVADLGIELGRCNREVLGSVLGGVAGGVIGSQVGKGDTRTVATIGGTIIGVMIGGSIGRSMDRVDHACVGQVLEQAPRLHTVEWANPDGGHYRVTPLRTYEGPQGRPCREYRTHATIEGRTQEMYGTACRQPDGAWRRVG